MYSAVAFRIGTDAGGEVEFELDPCSLNDQTTFLLHGWHRDKVRVTLGPTRMALPSTSCVGFLCLQKAMIRLLFYVCFWYRPLNQH